jgi:hypothetical protein
VIPARTLRPLHLFTDGDVIWAVDEFQPVAALLDAATGTLRDLVSWPRLPPPPTIETWQVLGCGRDLWVQPGAGAPIGRIGAAGLLAAGYSAGRSMVAVEPRGAWCLDGGGYRQQLVTSPDFEPGRLPHDQVIVVDPAGDVHRIDVDRPVRDVHLTEDGVYLQVDDAPHAMNDLGVLWEVSWRRAWLRIPAGPLPSSVEIGVAARPVLPPPRKVGAPGELRRLDPESVAIPGGIDITRHCWPLPPEPVDAGSYARSQRDRLGSRNPWWNDSEARNVTGELAGSWPHTRLVIGFDHADYPGVRLRRSVRLFDEAGRVDPPEFADVHLVEDLGTGRLPPPSAAVDGFLDV